MEKKMKLMTRIQKKIEIEILSEDFSGSDSDEELISYLLIVLKKKESQKKIIMNLKPMKRREFIEILNDNLKPIATPTLRKKKKKENELSFRRFWLQIFF